MNKNLISKFFLFFLIIAVIYACYLLFKPFLIEIIAATILVSIFYRPYEWLVYKFRGRKKIAALLMCLLVILIIIIPLVNLIIYTAQQSVIAYSEIIDFTNKNNLDQIIKNSVLEKMSLLNINSESLKTFMVDIAKKFSNWLVVGATSLVKGTTNFIISLIIIIFTMFFFFVDGKKIIEKIMIWTPLENKYDRKIFKKFRDISFVAIISTFVTAIAQGIIGAVGFFIIGLPVFFPGLFMAFFSLLPYIGPVLIWLPVGIYLLIAGQIWQGIFLLTWGGLIVSMIDNLIRAYIIKGKAQVHPIFIIFSILGGISLFGFWGIIFGPLIISLAATVMHIYETEYK
ncbi:AI-2E family transporter [Patescibacteria group bacterium]|nr:AI-2E family transporter [Patescibacteria group bacterium]